MAITVDEKVKEFIISEGMDFRLCTTCSGPALVSTLIKPPKDTDLKIPIGDRTLYISEVQRHFVSRITMDMVYDPEKLFSCPALSSIRGLY
ncbi:MAG: hypothetical protein LBI08_01315 [Methanomassiliicoccaceae archaeon]|jgi:hypothetical protein|nr:hypothetical protein [Methanomassiliicoccaceae archaeon]